MSAIPTPTPAAGRQEGERLKLAAHAVLAARREALVRRGRRALLLALLTRATATADDVRIAVELPQGVGPRCLGAVPGELARAGLIRRVGYSPSTRPLAHARPVGVWQLLDSDRARRWLAAHPDLPDPEPPTRNAPSGTDILLTLRAGTVAAARPSHQGIHT